MSENDKVLKMDSWGNFLGTRVLGERVRLEIIKALRNASGRAILDFEGVQGVTQSFADEAFRKLLMEIAPEEVSSRILIRGASEDVRAVIRYATSKRESREPIP